MAEFIFDRLEVQPDGSVGVYAEGKEFPVLTMTLMSDVIQRELRLRAANPAGLRWVVKIVPRHIDEQNKKLQRVYALMVNSAREGGAEDPGAVVDRIIADLLLAMDLVEDPVAHEVSEDENAATPNALVPAALRYPGDAWDAGYADGRLGRPQQVPSDENYTRGYAVARGEVH